MRNGLVAALFATSLVGVLAACQPARAQAPSTPFNIPAELQRAVSFRWTGSLDGAAQALARQVGYGVASLSLLGGPLPPDAPEITVSVDAPSTSVTDLVQQLSAQSTGRAAVVLDPDRRELRVYHSPGPTRRR